ncbi:hypothetical protein GCM10009416_08530 [Craurococcus roseus]|uniref:Uncharacterized protein n=1 Tax=Craurococcus roseus TaxID=77585 RepID=A0ABN1ERM0_9PROT
MPSPLPKAPMPSVIPTKRHAVPSGLVAPTISSPALRMEVKATPGAAGTRYGVSGVEGPVAGVVMQVRAPLGPARSPRGDRGHLWPPGVTPARAGKDDRMTC